MSAAPEAEQNRGGGRGRGGGAHSLVACLSRLTVDHAPLSRRSTVPTPLIDTPPTFGRSSRFFSIHYIKNCLLILSPSSFAVCSHHISPRIAIVFSLLSILQNSCVSHSFRLNFLISSEQNRVGGGGRAASARNPHAAYDRCDLVHFRFSGAPS